MLKSSMMAVRTRRGANEEKTERAEFTDSHSTDLIK